MRKSTQKLFKSCTTKSVFMFIVVCALISCTPTVKVEAPDKPIDVNMNVNIKHKVKVVNVDPHKKDNKKVDDKIMDLDAIQPIVNPS